jgi:5-methyltetrahydropteroyltriglutamate--homocysteine methyltransferase
LRLAAQVLGGYPRPRAVRRALRSAEAGELGLGEKLRSVIFASSQVIGVQLASGLSVVVDGMLDWHDIFRPFASTWRNVTPTALLRYFDNNFFYRIPLFTGEPEPVEPILPPRVRLFAPLAEPARLKVVVPGPVTFALMSEVRGDIKREDLAEAIANLLADEVRKSVEAGASFVQIDEPILSDPDASRDDASLAADLASRIASAAGGAETMISIYFYPVKRDVYEEVLNAKVDYVMVDAVAGGGRPASLVGELGGARRGAALGVIDARNIYADRFEEVKALAETAARGLRERDTLILTTSTWLDLIPYNYSIKKTRLLGIYAERVAEELSLEYESLWE